MAGPTSPSLQKFRVPLASVYLRPLIGFAVPLYVYFLLLYVRTLRPTIGGGDSGELATVADCLGVAHPSGYPTFLLLTKLSQMFGLHVLQVSSPALAMGLLSASSTAAAVAMLYLAVVVFLLRAATPSDAATAAVSAGQRASSTAAVAASAVFAAWCYGTSATVWEYAATVEVFALHNAATAAVVLLLIGYCRAPHPFFQSPRYLTGCAAVCGLAGSNLHTSVLLVGPVCIFVVFVCEYRRGTLGFVAVLRYFAAALCALVTPYVILAVFARVRPCAASWGDHSSLAGWWAHVLRSEYGTLSLASQEAAYSPTGLLKVLHHYVLDVFDQLGWSTLLLVLCGLVSAVAVFSAERNIATVTPAPHLSEARHPQRKAPAKPTGAHSAAAYVAPLLVGCWVFYVLWFGVLANFPLDVNPLLRSVLSRFWMQPLAYACVFAGAGMFVVTVVVDAFVNVLVTRARSTALAIGFFLLCIASLHSSCCSLITANDYSDAYAFAVYGRIIVDAPPTTSPAILLTRGDLITNAARFVLAVERQNGKAAGPRAITAPGRHSSIVDAVDPVNDPEARPQCPGWNGSSSWRLRGTYRDASVLGGALTSRPLADSVALDSLVSVLFPQAPFVGPTWLRNMSSTTLAGTAGVGSNLLIIDTEMLTFDWYVRRLRTLPRFSKVIFPGNCYHPYEEGGFSLEQFILANVGTSKGKFRVFYAGDDFKEDSVESSRELSIIVHGVVLEIVPTAQFEEIHRSVASFAPYYREFSHTPPPPWAVPQIFSHSTPLLSSWEFAVEGDFWKWWGAKAHHILGVAETANDLELADYATSLAATQHSFLAGCTGPLPAYASVFRNFGVVNQLLSRRSTGVGVVGAPKMDVTTRTVWAFERYVKLVEGEWPNHPAEGSLNPVLHDLTNVKDLLENLHPHARDTLHRQTRDKSGSAGATAARGENSPSF